MSRLAAALKKLETSGLRLASIERRLYPNGNLVEQEDVWHEWQDASKEVDIALGELADAKAEVDADIKDALDAKAALGRTI